MELFFDIYGNIMTREASKKYIDNAIVELIRFYTLSLLN